MAVPAIFPIADQAMILQFLIKRLVVCQSLHNTDKIIRQKNPMPPLRLASHVALERRSLLKEPLNKSQTRAVLS